MAYNPKNLSVLAYANGFTLWHYTTTDAEAEVDKVGYFNGAAEMVRVGDMILVNADTNGTPNGLILRIQLNAAGVVATARVG